MERDAFGAASSIPEGCCEGVDEGRRYRVSNRQSTDGRATPWCARIDRMLLQEARNSFLCRLTILFRKFVHDRLGTFG